LKEGCFPKGAERKIPFKIKQLLFISNRIFGIVLAYHSTERSNKKAYFPQ
jgi:hypothetical protein